MVIKDFYGITIVLYSSRIYFDIYSNKDTKEERNLFYIVFINLYAGKIAKYGINYCLAETFDSLHFMNFNLRFAHMYYSGMFELIHWFLKKYLMFLVSFWLMAINMFSQLLKLLF